MRKFRSVFWALARTFKRQRGARNRLPASSTRVSFFTPFLELLEDRTLLSASPAPPGGFLAPPNGAPGDLTGIAVVTAAPLPVATPSLFSYLGNPAEITAENQLTVYASGDIDLSGFRPDYLKEQGIRSLVVQGSDATNDTLHVDLAHGDIPLDITFHGGAGGYDTLVVKGASSGSYTPGKVFGEGIVQANSTRITFTGLEPVIVDGTGVAGGTYTFTAPSTGDGNDDITID